MNHPEPSPSGDENRGEQVQPQHVSARVPERVRNGAFSTGVIVMTGRTEFVLDFVQNIGPPASVAARVVVPHSVMPQFVDALRKNLDMYTDRFGAPPELPKQQNQGRKLSAQEIYDELKMSEDNLTGAYANGLMIAHTGSEFKLDFLSNLFPHSAVSSRVFVSAPQMPRIIESLQSTFQQFQKQVEQQQRSDPSPGPDAPEEPEGEGDGGPEDPPEPPQPLS